MKSPKLARPLATLATLVLTTSGVAASASALFAAPPDVAPLVVTHVCAAWHGRDGNSVDPDVPSLAGQGAPYLERQLIAFKTQRRTGGRGGIAGGLGEEGMHAAVGWFAQQMARPNPDPGPDSAALRQGAAIYRHGIDTKNV